MNEDPLTSGMIKALFALSYFAVLKSVKSVMQQNVEKVNVFENIHKPVCVFVYSLY